MKLNLNSLNNQSQSGGVILHNIFSSQSPILKIEQNGENFIYSVIKGQSNTFKEFQLKSLKVFINFILPYLSYNGKNLGIDAIKNIESLYAGSFGITLVYDDIVIKVSNSFMNNDPSHIDEITIMENMFKNIPAGTPEPPDTFSKYYGFLTSRKTHRLNKFSTYRGTMNINGNVFTDPLFKFDEAECLKNARLLEGESYLNTEFLDTILLIFLKREDMNLTKFIDTVVKTLPVKQKLEYIADFLNDMTSALNYLHRTRYLMHCDIKPDNIVATKQADGSYKFKLIDFGSISDIDKVTGITNNKPARSPLFNTGTYHEGIISYMYDEYCVLYSALVMIGVSLYDNEFIYSNLAEIAFDMKNKKEKVVHIINRIIDEINKKYPVLALQKYETFGGEENKKARQGYQLLLAFLLTAPVKSNVLESLK
jgi:hypothetical protein